MTRPVAPTACAWLVGFVSLFPPGCLAAQAADSALTACLAADTSDRWHAVAAAWSERADTGWTDGALRQRLLALGDADQDVRQGTSLADSMADSAYAGRMFRADSANAVELRAIMDRYGWPGRTLVGIAAARAAFLIAQHSEALQADALRLMRALGPREVAPPDLAMLEDRVRVHAGLPQRYGTQVGWSEGRAPAFDPIEDLAGLDARRDSVGLPPMTVYVCMLRTVYGRDFADPRDVGKPGAPR